MACSLASRSSRFAAALRADLDAISARHPKDPAVGTKSWLQSNKKLNVYLDTPNPHVSNPEMHPRKDTGLLRYARNDEVGELPRPLQDIEHAVRHHHATAVHRHLGAHENQAARR